MKKLLEKSIGILCLFTAILFSQCASVTQNHTDATNVDSFPLIPVRVGNKYGYIDKNGKYEIFPNFIEAGEFKDGRAIVRTYDGYGVIKKQGELIIEPQPEFDRIEEYDGTEMYIVLQCRRHFSLISAIGVIDYNGNWILKPVSCEDYQTIGDGVILYDIAINNSPYIEKRCLRGVIKDGCIIQKPIFKYGVIGGRFEDGNELVPVLYENKYGFIDNSGKIAINPIFDWTYGFSEGVALVKYEGDWHFIDKTGKMTARIPPYANDRTISEGLLAVKSQNAWGYMDKTGKVTIPFEYDDVEKFHEGLAAVEKDSMCGFINKKGKLVIPLQYPARNIKDKRRSAGVGNFTNGMAIIYCNNGKYGVINKKGEYVVPPKYDYMKNYGDYIIIRLDEKEGLLDNKGKVFIAPLFNNIIIREGVIFAQEKEYGKYGIIGGVGEWIAMPQFDEVL